MSRHAGERLGPHQVRAAGFGRRWRGLDPNQVYAYLRQVADEMDRLLREATTAETESQRIRQALRQWHPSHSGCRAARPGSEPDPEIARRPETGANRQPPRNGGHW